MKNVPSSLALVVGRKQGHDRKKSALRKLEKLSVSVRSASKDRSGWQVGHRPSAGRRSLCPADNLSASIVRYEGGETRPAAASERSR